MMLRQTRSMKPSNYFRRLTRRSWRRISKRRSNSINAQSKFIRRRKHIPSWVGFTAFKIDTTKPSKNVWKLFVSTKLSGIPTTTLAVISWPKVILTPASVGSSAHCLPRDTNRTRFPTSILAGFTRRGVSIWRPRAITVRPWNNNRDSPKPLAVYTACRRFLIKKSKVQSPKSKVQSPKSKVQCPVDKINLCPTLYDVEHSSHRRQTLDFGHWTLDFF